MKVLIACEYSGTVRDEFLKLGHDAFSCDILPCESDYKKEEYRHFPCDVTDMLREDQNWDLIIGHPPCTHLAVSGARWFTEGRKPWSLQEEALEFVQLLMDAPAKRICIENPVSVISTKIRKPEQIIQPYHFGHTTMKTTCLWLKNLPPLKHTEVVEPEMITMKNGKRMNKFHYDTFKLPKKERSHVRSKTFLGIAKAMASQWGSLDDGIVEKGELEL
jgi:site-specific DNA-cytosine methylase|tara:strand:+ start:116 stop:769 length:654 start_codon:yes stop_codon:yes gene_type:complete